MKTSMNKVELIGFAANVNEVKELERGNAMLRFSVATSEDYQKANGEQVSNTTWHNIVMWGDAARKAALEVAKGVQIELFGKIISRSYVDKDGNKRYVTEIQAAEAKKASMEN